MPDRTRPIRKEICLNEQELNLIQHKMRQLGTRNVGAYARKMLIDGYIMKVDYTEQKKLAAAVSRAASNINQICRRINSTGRCYDADVAELKARQAEMWELLSGAAEGRALTAMGFSTCGFSVTGFPDGGLSSYAPERSATGFQGDGFRAAPSRTEIHPLTNKK